MDERNVEYDSRALIIDGVRKIIISGSIHYTRSTPEMWPYLIQKAKEGGLDAIDTSIFWNIHEPRRRQYNFAGNLNFTEFFLKVKEAGLYGILRIGPYINAHWNFGGFPEWLSNIPGIKFRTDSDLFKNEIQRFITHIVNIAKAQKLFASQGGPIILAQIENEYGSVLDGYGDAGQTYLQWTAKLAVAQNIGIPWIMTQQYQTPASMIDAFNGFYGHNFLPYDATNPKIWTENWTGWYKKWGDKDQIRAPEDLAYAVARFFQARGVVQNYYMYHGGTNFGRTAGQFVTTSYDFNAPIDEYGNLNQPTWKHLQNLHAAIKVGEKFLTSINATVTTNKLVKGFDGGVQLTAYTFEATGERFCFLSNALTDPQDVQLELNKTFHVPPWSVSILENCYKQIFNTATFDSYNVTSMERKLGEDAPAKLNWVWREEYMQDTLQGNGTLQENELTDQKVITQDQSDFLWYMTSVNNDEKTPKNVTLSVHVAGEVIYAFVNGAYLGTHAGTNFDFERPTSLEPGINNITLLTATVGLQFSGVAFEAIPEGIPEGPVKLIGEYSTTDLSAHHWSLKVGLNGEALKLYDPKSQSGKWWTDTLPVASCMTWYKANFEAPPGTEPVKLDLQGMGKGHAWVNGNSIGRYWVTQIADPAGGCQPLCNYRGTNNNITLCYTNCGEPTQRWYHVPRSFLYEGPNTLILLEEAGGDPSNVHFEVAGPKKKHVLFFLISTQLISNFNKIIIINNQIIIHVYVI
ncbi:hypothetical protein K2173_016244 [Erythroxylum novogranatense]|uniref:Beta-galactosidase n=1 Tax=Erythroxylum novogranatense TaxID=1862640 RepID=A0AAV8SFW8_9ROSI|nr:hypothetical protein K2173_016244 [Erythroxylum novogranatense]